MGFEPWETIRKAMGNAEIKTMVEAQGNSGSGREFGPSGLQVRDARIARLRDAGFGFTRTLRWV